MVLCMKYTILINQKAIIDAGFVKKTDLIDWAILGYIQDWMQSPKAQLKNGHVWLNYNHLIEEMPMLNLKAKQSISNRVKKLHNLKLIDKFQDKDDLRLYVKVTDLYSQVVVFNDVPEKGHPSQSRNTCLLEGTDYGEKETQPTDFEDVHEIGQGVPFEERGVPEKGHSTYHQDHSIFLSPSIGADAQNFEDVPPPSTPENLNDRQAAFQWAQSHPFWSGVITDNQRFLYNWAKRGKNGFRTQWEQYKAQQAQAEQQAQAPKVNQGGNGNAATQRTTTEDGRRNVRFDDLTESQKIAHRCGMGIAGINVTP